MVFKVTGIKIYITLYMWVGYLPMLLWRNIFWGFQNKKYNSGCYSCISLTVSSMCVDEEKKNHHFHHTWILEHFYFYFLFFRNSSKVTIRLYVVIKVWTMAPGSHRFSLQMCFISNLLTTSLNKISFPFMCNQKCFYF